MTFEVEVNGRTRSVSIERTGNDGCFRVSVDGEVSVVDARRTGSFGFSLVLPAAHQATKVAVAPGSAPGEQLAYLGGRSTVVSVNARRTGRGAADAAGAAQGEQRVTAPMPGRVVRVLVAPGDLV